MLLLCEHRQLMVSQEITEKDDLLKMLLTHGVPKQPAASAQVLLQPTHTAQAAAAAGNMAQPQQQFVVVQQVPVVSGGGNVEQGVHRGISPGDSSAMGMMTQHSALDTSAEMVRRRCSDWCRLLPDALDGLCVCVLLSERSV